MLRAQNLVLDLVRALAPLCATLRRRAPSLADQLERAATSVALNLAEGSRRGGADRRRVYRIAAGEAQEVRAALDVAAAWGHLDAAELDTARDLADQVGAVNYVLAR